MNSTRTATTAHAGLVRWALRGSLGLLLLLALSACDTGVPLLTFTTTTGADSVDVVPGDGICADSEGECSLRAAVMETNVQPGLDRIVLAPDVVHELTIEGTGEDASLTGDLDVTDALEIGGNGTVDANGIDRVLDLRTNLGSELTPVELADLTIRGGISGDGAGVRSNENTALSMIGARVTDNTATTGAPVSAAALSASQTTVDDNLGVVAGAIDHTSSGELVIVNSTISGNTATGGAGGIRTVAADGQVLATTITDNSGTTAGGVQALAGLTTAEASIIADQAAGTDCAGAVASGGFDIESGTSCGFGTLTDHQNVAVLLKPLAENGGTHPTHLPSFGSPATDAWTAAECSLADDQRGVSRPQGANCDIGAVEAAPAELTGDDCGPPLYLAPGAQLQYCDMSNADMVGVDLTGADLTGANLSIANATLATFDGADLTDVQFTNTWLVGVDFRTSTITSGTSFVEALALGATFGGMDLSGVDFTNASLNAADLTETTLTGTTLTDATLKGALIAYADDLSGAIDLETTLPSSWRGTTFAASHLDVTGLELGAADFTNSNFFGATGFGSTDTSLVTWNNTICPDGSNSNGNGSTCVGHFDPPAPPVVELDAGTPDGNNGWYVTSPVPSSVTVTVASVFSPFISNPTCTDDGIPVVVTGSAPGPWSFDVEGDAIHDLECSVTDLADNTGTGTATVQIDTQGFDYTVTESPEPNENGWHASGPVTLAVALATPSVSGLDIDASDCTESIDGGPATSIPFSEFTIDTNAGTASIDIEGNGVHVVECDVVTNAGIHTIGGATVRIDDEVPTGTTEIIPPAPNANGWYNTEVTLRATLSTSNISGIDFDDSGCTRNGVPVPLTEYDFTPPGTLDIVVHDDGIFEYVCTVTTNAGVSDSSSATVQIDKVAIAADVTIPAADYVDPFPSHPGEWYLGPVVVSAELLGTNISGIDWASGATFCTDNGVDIPVSAFTQTGPTSVELSIEGNGTHEIICQVTTGAGLVSTDSATFQIDSDLALPHVFTVAGTGTSGYNGDGIDATTARIGSPEGVAVDSAGNTYIADTANHRIRMVDTNGTISTVAGTGTSGYNGDGIDATTAELSSPRGIALDSAGNLYIADSNNQRIRMVDTNGTISTVAGTGISGYNGDGIDADTARLANPRGVAVDAAGNLYIADWINQRVRMVDTSGTITTVAGTGTDGYNGDGVDATTAELSNPFGLAVDSAGNLYIADPGNHRVRMVDTGGTITTVAGTGSNGYNGDGIDATTAHLNNPNGVAVDAAGNLYIADRSNHRVRMVDTGGTITTVAGTGTSGYNGDQIVATTGRVSNPYAVAVDSTGALLVADTGNHRIRKIS
jgi:uncharacterized protein YjbI with pentapeptide repeats/sugar lactone lactonase YvrE